MIGLEVIPALRHFGAGLIPWSPLGRGLLGSGLEDAREGRRGSPFIQDIAGLRPQLEAWKRLCNELGDASAVVALAWLLHDPDVTVVISGPRTVKQLRQNLKAPSLKLPDDVLARLDEIWPGPGGEAPEAYAWWGGACHADRVRPPENSLGRICRIRKGIVS